MTKKLSIDGKSIEKRYVVIKKEAMKEEFKEPIENRIIFATGGFGTSPTTSGTKVFGYYVIDGVSTTTRRWHVERFATKEEVEKAKEQIKEKCKHKGQEISLKDNGDKVILTVKCDYCKQTKELEDTKKEWLRLFHKYGKIKEEENNEKCLHLQTEIRLETKTGTFHLFGHGEIAYIHYHCKDCGMKGSIETAQNLLIELINLNQKKEEKKQ